MPPHTHTPGWGEGAHGIHSGAGDIRAVLLSAKLYVAATIAPPLSARFTVTRRRGGREKRKVLSMVGVHVYRGEGGKARVEVVGRSIGQSGRAGRAVCTGWRLT